MRKGMNQAKRRSRSVREWTVRCFAVGIVLAIGLLAGGCATKLVTTVAPGDTPIELSAVAVYPFQVRFRAEPAMSYQKTVDLVNAAVAPRRFLVYSYGDFQLFSLDSLDVYEGRSLLATV